MNKDNSNIESALHQAPKPTAPVGLRDSLLSDANVAMKRQQKRSAIRPEGLLGTWIPRLGFALIFTLAAAFIAAQSNRYPSKHATEEALKELELKRNQLVDEKTRRVALRGRLEHLNHLKQQQTELRELKEEKDHLIALVDESKHLETENQRLHGELLRFENSNDYLVRDPLGEARENAKQTMCTNNLKQLSLAYQIAKSEGSEAKSIYDLIPHLAGSGMQLYCPSDTDKEQVAKETSSEVGPENISYRFELKAPEEASSSTVVVQCPVHGSVGLFDGSVHTGKAFQEGKAKLVRDQANLRIEFTQP
jgi:hypothetical protein